jgi:3-oxoadipate enol-lactonase
MTEFIDHNHGKLYYEVTGSGEPIVFIHGFTLDQRMWQPQVEFFVEHGYQVITYDARGFGKSSMPTHSYSHDEDLRALLKHLKIKSAHVVGLSMGGRIALNFTLAYPEMVRTLTLMDSALDGYDSEVDWDVHAKEEGVEQAKQNWMNHELFTGTKEDPEVIPDLKLMVDDYSGWHWLHKDPQDPEFTNARERLQEIEIPTLIIVGEKDLRYFHNIAEVLAEGIPGAEKVVISGAGHMVNMETTDQCNELLFRQVKGTNYAPQHP